MKSILCKPLLIALSGAGLLCPLPLLAGEGKQDINAWLELGAGAVHNGNGRFGEYRNLLQSEGLLTTGAFGLHWRDGEDPYRHGNLQAHSTIEGVGLSADYGRRGDYRIGFDYRQFDAISRERFTTVYADRDATLTLPAGYTGTASALPFGGHAGVQRGNASLELARHWGSWTLMANLVSETKEGSRIIGASERFGDAALLPAPVDQRHDSIDMQLRYQGEQWHLNTGWYYSSFGNNARQIAFDNPINLAAPVRILDTGPDNEFSRLSLDGGYRFGMAHQLSWYISRGDGRQHDSFVQPIATGGALFDDLDAHRVDTDLRLGFHGRLSPRLDYRLRWDYRDRDNRTDLIPLLPGQFNHLYNSRRQRWAAEAGYRLPASMKLRGGVEETRIERTTRGSEHFTDEVDQTRLWAELRLPAVGRLNASLRVETTDRDNSLSAHRLHAIDPTAPSLALPDYLKSGRDWQYQIRGDMAVTDNLMLAASYRHVRDRFDGDLHGLRDRTSDEYSLTLSWQANTDLALSAYGLYQNFRLTQDGLEFHPTGAFSHANARWRQWIADDSRTLGINLRWQTRPAVETRIDLSYSDNDSSYRSRWLEDADTGESAGTTDHLPGFGVDVLRLNAGLDWQYNPETRIGFHYLYENFASGDWAWEAGDFERLAFGWREPNYDAHALWVTVRYSWP